MCNLNKHETDLRKRLQITEASVEGVVRQMEEQGAPDNIYGGLQWAFQDLKDKIDEVLEEAQ